MKKEKIENQLGTTCDKSVGTWALGHVGGPTDRTLYVVCNREAEAGGSFTLRGTL